MWIRFGSFEDKLSAPATGEITYLYATKPGLSTATFLSNLNHLGARVG